MQTEKSQALGSTDYAGDSVNLIFNIIHLLLLGFLGLHWNPIIDSISDLQLRGDIEDNSKIIILISQQKHML